MSAAHATSPLLLVMLVSCGRIGFDAGSSGDAALPRCFSLDEPFDGPGLPPSWPAGSSGGAPAPIVTGGAMVLDVLSSVSDAGIGPVILDLSDAIVTATIRDYPFISKTQVYLRLKDPANVHNFLQLAHGQPDMIARFETGVTSDDVTATISPPPVFRLQIATRPMGSGTEVTWSYSLSETGVFVELRRDTETIPLGNAELYVEYQTYAPATTEPPPIRVEQLTVEVPCP